MFSVGWNDIGGWRLWLRDRAGNEFYYAHLSAYSPLAVNGRQRARPATCSGFMGKTGDAEFSPVHLHFEIHPVALLAIAATTALSRRTRSSTRGGAPRTSPSTRAAPTCRSTGRLPRAAGVAPPAGAVLLEADDISSTSGLVPGALESTLTGRAPKSPTGGQDR